MLIDSINLSGGSRISNLVVSEDTVFPSSPDRGELFYKIGDGLYLYNGSSWLRMLLKNEAASSWGDISNKPTTLVGYGITDAIYSAARGASNGVASLDSSGKVPSAQLPSYVDDVIEFPNLASMPVSGVTGIIYIAIDTNKIYRWTGSTYIEVVASPGTTDVIPEGTTNLYFTNARANTAISNFASTGNVHSASQLATARTISLTGAVAGSASFDGSDNITITTTGSGGGGEGGGGAASFYAQFSGPVAPFTGVSPYYPRNTITITNIFASLSAPASTLVTARVNVNGVEKQIVTIAAGQTTSTTVSNFAVQPTEYVTVDVVGGTGNNLSLRFDY